MTLLSSPWLLAALGIVICLLLIEGWRRTRHLYRKPTIGNPVGMPTPTDAIEAFEIEPALVHYQCGHDYAVNFGHDFYGMRMAVHPEQLAKRLQCGECLLRDVRVDSIRCASCGFAIIPNQPVAVYPDDGRCNPSWSTRTPGGEGVIGCLRIACCPDAEYFGGYWTMNGFISAHEAERMAVQSAMAAEARAVGVGDDGMVRLAPAEMSSTVASDAAKKPN